MTYKFIEAAMMIDLDTLFRYKVPNVAKLLAAGFVQQGTAYVKETPIMKKQFDLQVTVQASGKISYKVIEFDSREEYLLVHMPDANGAFVGEVRTACEKVLTKLASTSFDTEIMKAEQTRRVINFIDATFGAAPEFLWEGYPKYAAFRRKDNAKWFAIIMTIDRSKLGLPGHGNIEIIDLKAEPDQVAELLQLDAYYPAYHMNKKHWFTICLDGSLPDETLHALLSSSYHCAANK